MSEEEKCQSPTRHEVWHAEEQGMPANGDRIMILKKQWLDMILSGCKTIELRGQTAKSGPVWLGNEQKLHGRARIQRSQRLTYPQLVELQQQHRVPPTTLPYPKTYALYLENVRPLKHRIPFWHPRGAIGWVRYRNTQQAAATAAAKRTRKAPHEDHVHSRAKEIVRTNNLARPFPTALK